MCSRVERLEAVGELLQRVDVEVGVLLDAAIRLDLGDRLLERLAVDPARDVAEHLQEAPVGVPREALVLGRAGEPLDGGVVEAEVEDRVEHPGHRLAGAGADGDEQRVLVVAELLARVLLQALERLGDLLGHAVGLRLAGLHVGDARLGGDREPAGTRSAPSTRVISATFAPLPPSRSRMSFEPSAKSYTHCSAMAQNTRCFSTETVKPWPAVLRQVMPVRREVQRRRPNVVACP